MFAKVRKDLQLGTQYYMKDGREYNNATREMIELAGKVVKITKDWGQYKVVGVGSVSCYHWTDTMFEWIGSGIEYV